MKILWVINSILPQIAIKEKIKYGVNEGWLSGLSLSIQQLGKGLEFYVCFPSDTYIRGQDEKMHYFSYSPEKKIDQYNVVQENEFFDIFSEINPDIIHIMGSEYVHSLSATKAAIRANCLESVVLSIQGLVSVCAHYYTCMLPEVVIKKCTVRDWVKRDSLKHQQKQYFRRGKFEVETIRTIKNIIGRTNWDYACSHEINPNITYYRNNETLRGSFYENVWSYDKCEKHSIFVTQATLPYKGFHNLLVVLSIVKKKFPDVKLYVASNVNYTKRINSFAQSRSSYTNYIITLIKRYDLFDNIIFCGALKENEMISQYKRSNVFVLPSAIENSPNSLGEAMILGMPIVTNDVGGVSDMITHKKEGYICQPNAPYMMAYYITYIFELKDKVNKMCQNAREHALSTHGKQKNFYDLLHIYNEILKKR